MGLLIFSQIVFNLSASVAIILYGILFAIVVYHLIGIMKNLQNISDNLDGATDELRERIIEIMDRLSSLPILSYFLKTARKSKDDTRNKKRSQ